MALLARIWDFLAITSVIFGIVCGAILTPIACLIYRFLIWPWHREKLLKKAIRKGHVVEAHRVANSVLDNVEKTAPEKEDVTTYQYAWNGKEYTFRSSTTDDLSAQVTLYFVRSPQKAATEDEVGLHERHWPMIFGLLVLLLTIIALIYLWFWATTLVLG
jgi:hypothetical protein